MKRIIALALLVSVLLGLAACGDSGGSAATNTKTTLMIYMIGSDLEAKGGAGTNDMEEILKSQVDLSQNEVLIYAGGTKKWHNSFLSAEGGHSILRLTDSGFVQLQSRKEMSMGDASALSDFLNYAYKNYPASNFALILWDHGNGPLIGYGKDMLHEDDSITLLEMKQALEETPFQGENKLAWVGFDACLMSSVELACIWQEHARYLIASQEIEPAFGWDYSFLNQLGKLDTVALAEQITASYMASCMAYYERRNYDQRDTTLACMDLSELDGVKAAIEGMFAKAKSSVTSEYSTLAASRVNTRALGRATTGSEYDLIDLADMAEQMRQQYPAEAEALKKAIGSLVVNNTTNAEGCCGISLYYPFYNKSYYEKSWSDVYSKLNVLPAYTAYLADYAKQWLGNDLVQTVASSVLPSVQSENEFILQLTDQQAEHYADANYYILRREGEQLYTRVYTSSNVTKADKVLTANFDGNVLYAKNDLDQYWLPAVAEHDTVGDYTRYSTYVNITNNRPIIGDNPEGYVHQVAGHRFYISVNNQTKQVKTSALVPFDTTVNTEELVGGKKEDADLSQWSEYYFLEERHKYLERDEKGTILPLEDWEESSYHSAMTSRVNDGVDFVFAPIPAGEYYLMFEIEDVQGNRYCSELLEIQSDGGDFSLTEKEPIETKWETGEQIALLNEKGVTVSLTTVTEYERTRYALAVENTNSYDVALLGHEIMYNGHVYCPDGTFGYFVIPAGQTVIDDGFAFGDAENLGKLSHIDSLQFLFSVVTAKGDQTLVHRQEISVNMSKYASELRKDPPEDSFFSNVGYYKNEAPARRLRAQEQVMFEHNGLRGTLLGLGGDGSSSSKMVLTFCFENTGDTEQTFTINGVEFDGVFLNKSTGPITVLPNTMIYKAYVISQEDLDLHQITGAASVAVNVSFMEFSTLLGGGGFSQIKQYPIDLAEKGTKVTLNRGEKLLYEDEAVQIFLQQGAAREYGGYLWICTLVNKSDQDLLLGSQDVTVNGDPVDLDSVNASVLAPYNVRCPAGKTTVFEVTYLEKVKWKLQVSLTPQFYDMAGENLLRVGTEAYLLKK